MSARRSATGEPHSPRLARRWAAWLVALLALTVAMRLVQPRLDKAHVALAYLLTVLGASAAGGRALGLTIASVSFVAFNYLFLPPYHTLVITNPLDWIVLVAFLITSVVAAELLYRATSTADAAIQRAEEVDRLAALGAETLSAPGAEEALQAVVSVIRDSIHADACEVYRRDADGSLVLVALATRDAAPDDAAPATASPRAVDGPADVAAGVTGGRPRVAGTQSLLRWLGDHGRSAVELSDGTIRLAPEEVDDPGTDWAIADREGDGVPPAVSATGTPVTQAIAGSRLASLRYVIRPDPRARRRGLLGGLPELAFDSAVGRRTADALGEAPDVRALLLPLLVRDHTVGVLRIRSRAGVAISAEQARLLVALAYFAALGVERVRLVESAERAEAERRVESLRSALLTAVSHDLRTPLTTIKGIAHEVAHGADPSRAAVIEAEADHLNDLVGDLLELSRIQAGALRPTIAVNTADELIGAALQRAAGALRNRAVVVELPPDDVLAGRFDFSQTLRVLVNLLENAAKYTPLDAPIELRAHRAGDRLVVTVLDRGPGVPPSEHDRIFEPFYRPPGTPPDVRGTGLGLSIARGLAEAQGGTLGYAPRAEGGSTFVLELPAVAPIPIESESTAAGPG